MEDVLTSSHSVNDILRFIGVIFILCIWAIFACIVIYTLFYIECLKYKIMMKIWNKMTPPMRFILLIIFFSTILSRLLK
jgi:amino acid transporter